VLLAEIAVPSRKAAVMHFLDLSGSEISYVKQKVPVPLLRYTSIKHPKAFEVHICLGDELLYRADGLVYEACVH
jgi:hypothetical protein